MVTLERTNGQTQSPDSSASYTHILTLPPRAKPTDITEAYAAIVPLVTPMQNIVMIVGQPVAPDNITNENPVEKMEGQDINIAGKFPIRKHHGDVVALDDATQAEYWMSTIIRNAHRLELTIFFVRINKKASVPPTPTRKRQFSTDIYRYNGGALRTKTSDERQTIYNKIGLTDQEIAVIELDFQNKTYREISRITGIPWGSLPYHLKRIRKKFGPETK